MIYPSTELFCYIFLSYPVSCALAGFSEFKLIRIIWPFAFHLNDCSCGYLHTSSNLQTGPSLLSHHLTNTCAILQLYLVLQKITLQEIECWTIAGLWFCSLLINWFCTYRKRLSIEKKILRKNLGKNLEMKLKSVIAALLNYFPFASWGANVLIFVNIITEAKGDSKHYWDWKPKLGEV